MTKPENLTRLLTQLLRKGLLSNDQKARLDRLQSESGGGFIELLLRAGFVEPNALAQEIAETFHLPLVLEKDWPRELLLGGTISPRFMRDHKLLPLRVEHDRITLVVADPTNETALKAVEVACEKPLTLAVAPVGTLLAKLERLLGENRKAQDSADATDAVSEIVNAREIEEDEQLQDLALNAPVIDLVNRLFRDASIARATDLHIEPQRGRVIVRQRIDGVLREATTLAPDLGRAAVSRIKILTHLNIAEKRLPQDGRARLRIGDRDYDLRVATMPTIHGESISIRFLNASHQIPELGRLGLTEKALSLLKAQINQPYGLIIVTGPTGSGKTTTLAAILSYLNEPSRKILSIEDPVEYQVEGVNQIQIHNDIGLNFASALRSILRLDPDIIMVGEMRDSETARIGVNSALTGHLVLTTLHTNSAIGAITRLMDLEVQAFLVASTLRCVIAQRLVRGLCLNCRQVHEPGDPLPERTSAILKASNLSLSKGQHLWRAVGCEDCEGTGYRGRLAIFELLIIDEQLRRLIQPNVEVGALLAIARQKGMTSMLEDGFQKCTQGLTTVEEVARMTLVE